MHSRRIWIVAAIAVVAIALFVALATFKSAMPKRIRLLSGPEGSAYHALGERYAAELDKRGLATELLATAGGVDNLQRLAACPDDTIGLAPSTLSPDAASNDAASELVSLGSIGVEPLWLFYRSELGIRTIPDLAGRVVGTKGPDTVSDTVAGKLIEQNGIGDEVEIRHLDGATVESLGPAIRRGDLDAAFVTGSAQAPLIDQLLRTADVSFLSFIRADTYVVLIPGLTTLTIPAGVFDLAHGVPPQDATLLSAATTRSVVHDYIDFRQFLHDMRERVTAGRKPSEEADTTC